jgi:hypothetical protein
MVYGIEIGSVCRSAVAGETGHTRACKLYPLAGGSVGGDAAGAIADVNCPRGVEHDRYRREQFGILVAAENGADDAIGEDLAHHVVAGVGDMALRRGQLTR